MAVGRGTGDVSSKETGRPIDLAPTLLYALGLPASRELAGAPLLSLFDPEFVQRYPVRHVESYGKRRAPALQGQPMDQEMIERLRSLGYVR
jgi:arylsulfatase A-like enzyme